ncbi:small ribosomal subunit Rsm22 family protein [Halopenitus salinus]|uniref:Small ribosomal subunit Rsm22 family protein n=1 Tax=Halopenitus salinus TaxID=1198295 RepID=A0ABD5UWK2_9EURY
MIDRDAVRDAARYLRRVRPIDPDEISEYVEGGAHPAVVERVLREEAYDLGLREGEDGTFVPIEDGPASPPGWGPEALPERYAFALKDRLVGEFGANWHDGESGDELREAIRRLKRDYYYENHVEYDRIAALGYAIYHLADYYAAIGYVLDDLAANGLLGRRLRVLDVGAGVGGPALGLHDYLPDDALVEYVAVEPSAAADVLSDLLAETERNFRTTIRRETAESYFGLEDDREDGTEDGSEGKSENDGQDEGTPRKPFDLVLFGNVLSELSDPAAVVNAALSSTASDGSVIALAPADRNTAIGLREIERAVTTSGNSAQATVYSPTLSLWPDATASDRGWSFDVRPDLEVPAFQRRLDEAADRGPTDEPGEFENVDVQFAYSILRTDGTRRVDVHASSQRHMRMSETDAHVTDRVNLLAVKLSHDLADGGNPIYLIGDGSQSFDHYAVCTRETSLNRTLSEAGYGAVCAFENALVLWNDDEEAYNLVIDDEAVVDLVAPAA